MTDDLNCEKCYGRKWHFIWCPTLPPSEYIGSKPEPDICKHGHDYNVTGVYTFPDGRRACKECRRLDSARRRALKETP